MIVMIITLFSSHSILYFSRNCFPKTLVSSGEEPTICQIAMQMHAFMHRSVAATRRKSKHTLQKPLEINLANKGIACSLYYKKGPYCNNGVSRGVAAAGPALGPVNTAHPSKRRYVLRSRIFQAQISVAKFVATRNSKHKPTQSSPTAKQLLLGSGNGRLQEKKSIQMYCFE